ncbi:MAG: hypothetical protein LBQ31_00680 [Bacteroidales bacterium]|nr:hypothetical protein [Bacteroidales bacterium]
MTKYISNIKRMNNPYPVFLTSLTSADTSAGSRFVSFAPCPKCGVLCLAGSREQGAGSREQGAGSREQGIS